MTIVPNVSLNFRDSTQVAKEKLERGDVIRSIWSKLNIYSLYCAYIMGVVLFIVRQLHNAIRALRKKTENA